MKTAIQIAIDELQETYDKLGVGCMYFRAGVKHSIDRLTELLQVEREQIETATDEAYKEGQQNCKCPYQE